MDIQHRIMKITIFIFFHKYISIIRLETPEPISLCSVMAAPSYFMEGSSFPHFRGSDMQIGVGARLSIAGLFMMHLKGGIRNFYYLLGGRS